VRCGEDGQQAARNTAYAGDASGEHTPGRAAQQMAQQRRHLCCCWRWEHRSFFLFIVKFFVFVIFAFMRAPYLPSSCQRDV